MVLNYKDEELLIKTQYPNADLSTKYHFYYDETNNIRKFYLKETDFNSNSLDNFILGGILFEKEQSFDESFIDSLKLQNSPEEVKFKKIAHGEFLECLKSQRLTQYLDYISTKDVYVHYSSFNLLYWSLIDIVESAEENFYSPEYDAVMKDALYLVTKQNLNKFVKFFIKYGYPNIKKEDVKSFVEELISYLKEYISVPELHFGLQMLKGLLEINVKNNNLLFLSGEEKGVLVKSFLHEYMRPIGIFSNSIHIFDEEITVKEKIKDFQIMKGRRELNSYSFIDSKNNRWVQMSDVFVGVIGKLKIYLNRNSYTEIEDSFCNLNGKQKNNLRLISRILNHSMNKNIVFFHNIDSMSEMHKMNLVLQFI